MYCTVSVSVRVAPSSVWLQFGCSNQDHHTFLKFQSLKPQREKIYTHRQICWQQGDVGMDVYKFVKRTGTSVEAVRLSHPGDKEGVDCIL